MFGRLESYANTLVLLCDCNIDSNVGLYQTVLDRWSVGWQGLLDG